ncbi:GlcG/HbpS family heme-binding protein [Streptomyces mirabilis]|uniref:GlcG/HbpS family heme-binding protein n=1 Tax=Streptomyces mirabilis TaxID=68239 RepID=UPI00368A470D
MSISLDTAQAMVERARVQAAALDVPTNIAVVDGGGHLLAFARMDGAILGSIDIAPAKAKTSILSTARARTCAAGPAVPLPPPNTPTAA